MFRIEDMGINSLQVCMDSSDWLQGAISDENAGLMDSSSPPITTPTGEDILTCSRPIIERRLRPQHEQALKCPRCESTHTKFCYYNNYSLSQPRYFCKTCRRYWTKGGTLRNIPVGGGCRKNKKVSSSSSNKKPSSSSSSDRQINLHRPSSSSIVSSPLMLDQLQIDGPSYNHMSRNKAQITDLQLAFPEQLQFSAGLFNNPAANNGYLFDNIGPAPIEFMDNKYHDHAFMGSNGENFGGIMNIAGQNPSNVANYHGITAPFGLSCFDHGISNPGGGGGGASVLESCQRLTLPYDDDNNQNNHHHHYHHEGVVDVKPNAKVLSLEWHDCNSDAGIKDSFGYGLGGLGSWTGLMNGYGPSATNPLV